MRYRYISGLSQFGKIVSALQAGKLETAGFGEPDPNVRDIDEYETVLSSDINGDDGPNAADLDGDAKEFDSVGSYGTIVRQIRLQKVRQIAESIARLGGDGHINAPEPEAEDIEA